jgi:hypothetical protein
MVASGGVVAAVSETFSLIVREADAIPSLDSV